MRPNSSELLESFVGFFFSCDKMKYAFSYISMCLGKCRQSFFDCEKHLKDKNHHGKDRRTEEMKAQSTAASDDSYVLYLSTWKLFALRFLTVR